MTSEIAKKGKKRGPENINLAKNLPDAKHNEDDKEDNGDTAYDGKEDDQYWGENGDKPTKKIYVTKSAYPICLLL